MSADPAEEGPGQLPVLPSASEMGIHDAFKAERPTEHEVLYRLRLALFLTSLAHARVAESAHRQPAVAAQTLKDLSKVLASTRAEASRVDQIYRLWRASKLSTKSSHHEFELFVDQLPTSGTLREEVARRRASQKAKWWPVVQALGLMISCDVQAEADASPSTFEQPASYDDGTLLYRQPVSAVLTTWRFTRDPGSPTGWDVSAEREDRVLVTHPRDTRAVRLPLSSRTDVAVEVGFDVSGALTSFSTDVTGKGVERVRTIAALPAALSAAAKAGGELGGALSPSAARAGALKQQIDLLEQQAKHAGLLNPATDKLADLRQQLVEAELDARLALAQRIVEDPTSVVITSHAAITPS